MTSYKKLLLKIEAFCDAHLQIKRYGGEFKEQMPNISTGSEKYPIVFVTPNSGTPLYDTNQITLDIYCVDIIQKDRTNINTIVSDCHLMLTDLYGYFSQGDDLSIDVIGQPIQTPLNNLDLDYVAGWMMIITFELGGYCVNAIPMLPIVEPVGGECDDATIIDSDSNIIGTTPSGATFTVIDSNISNSDDSYDMDILATQSLELPDITHTDSDGSPEVLPAQTPMVCTPCIPCPPVSTCAVGAKLMKTGQIVSYRTGDDGDLQEGREDDFFTLGSVPLNLDGSPTINTTTNRFSDELGNTCDGTLYYDTDGNVVPYNTVFLNKIIIDWSQYNGVNVLGYYNGNAATQNNWSDSIDSALATSVSSFVSGWYQPNRKQMLEIFNDNFNLALYYLPFRVWNASAYGYWTSTTTSSLTTYASMANASRFSLERIIKTATYGHSLPCRNFTVIGTTLT